MEKEGRHDLHISGAGSASGGIFGNVAIEGTAKITGDIDCLDLMVDGVARIHGNIKAETGKVNGVALINGAWQSDKLIVSGYSKIAGDISVKQIRIEGSTRLNSSISAEEVEIAGHAKIKGDCEAEVFISRGVFTIGGMLNAGSIDILSIGRCQVRDVGGENISVRRGNPNLLVKILTSILSSPGFITETIEADDISLEYSSVKVVRGGNVRIGPGCHIDLVEYRDSIECDDRANVKELRRTGSDER